jgi:hypothetical protein
MCCCAVQVKEPSVFTFWAKSAVDIDQRMIQLKSSSYTTTAILDTLTAACVQVCTGLSFVCVLSAFLLEEDTTLMTYRPSPPSLVLLVLCRYLHLAKHDARPFLGT